MDAERVEALYEQLLEDYRTLEARELVALEEVEELTGQNVALMSFGTGDQKITYVENVRRELAMAKQVGLYILRARFPRKSSTSSMSRISTGV